MEDVNLTTNTLTPLRNTRGQAAIFIALMFNVLFVFFAMTINIALVVHDKINMQNSVDMASYYAAAKQAEILNVIAHENYQIRQSYKLLAWRYRVLGLLGLDRNGNDHPVRTGDTADTVFKPAQTPALCMMTHAFWEEAPENENLCNVPNLSIPRLPEVKVIAGFLGLNAGIAALSRQLIAQFDDQCSTLSAINWNFGMSFLHAFRLDQRNRKQVIYGLAENLSKNSGGDFRDLDGKSVMDGARATFLKNLTYANRQAFDSGGSFQMMNSLEGVEPTEWLVEIKTMPMVVYADTKDEGNCTHVPRPVSELPSRSTSRDKLKAPIADRGFEASDLMIWADGNFLSDSDYQFSMGVEKNPWIMAYVGVKASAAPRQIFFPFGKGVNNVVRSFAKPFGGRIGPWYQSRWDKGSKTSTGEFTDPLSPPRVSATGFLTSPDDPRRLPNYSRYPGDEFGLTTRLAQNSLAPLKMGFKMRYDYYRNIKVDMEEGRSNDILAWNEREDKAPEIRNLELAVVAPDIFDITYYSIEPGFAKTYFPKLKANKNILKIKGETVIRSDLGHSTKGEFSVLDQMAVAKSKNIQKSEAYYYVRDKAHLLTSWLPGEGTYNYGVEASMANFGKCKVSDDDLKFPNPGACVAGGGRVGYSVKLIGRDALLSSDHAIGGAGGAAGPINNPPKPGDGW